MSVFVYIYIYIYIYVCVCVFASSFVLLCCVWLFVCLGSLSVFCEGSSDDLCVGVL